MKTTQIILTMMLMPLLAVAQLPSYPDNIQSPNAASLGEYGKFDVSLFTGAPNIEIPLYEFPIGDHKLPISVFYNINGIKPGQRPGWLGVGWNLNCGGVITRVQKGRAPDEYKPKTQYNGYQQIGYFYPENSLNYPNWDTWDFLLNSLKEIEKNINKYDPEPDEFIFNFFGFTGSFCLNEKKEWIVKSNDPISVTCDMSLIDPPAPRMPEGKGSCYSKILKGFQLTDGDGVIYEFGMDDNAIEISLPFFNQNSTEWTASSWYLSKIVYPDKTSVKFNYIRGKYTNLLWAKGRRYAHTVDSNLFKDYFSQINNGTPGGFEGSLISPVYLYSIELPTGTIQLKSVNVKQGEYSSRTYTDGFGSHELASAFNVILESPANTDLSSILSKFDAQLYSRRLDKIDIVDLNGNKIRTCSFSFDLRSNRYFMTKLSINDIQSYTFEYQQSYSIPPPEASTTDHWGYCNGIKSIISQDDYVESRNPVADKMGRGALISITYPTGGRTEFEYEPHDCSQTLSEDRISTKPYIRSVIGGLRLKQVCNYSGDSIIEKREYRYTKNYVSTRGSSTESSGIINGIPTYERLVYGLSSTYGVTGSIHIKNCPTSFHTTGLVVPEFHIGYSEVIEKFADGSFSVYQFSNFDTAPNSPALAAYLGQPYYRHVVSFRSQDRGLLIKKSDYTPSFSLSRQQAFEYVNTGNEYVPAINLQFIKLPGVTFVEAVTYKRFTYQPKIAKEVITEYYPDSNPYIRTKSYTYNKYGQPSTIKEVVNGGDSLQTSIQYLWEMLPRAEKLHQLNLVSNKIDDWQFPGKKISMDYDEFNNGKLLKPTHITTSHLLSNSMDTTYCMYDSHGKIIYKETNGVKGTVYLWGYNRQHIVAKIDDVTYVEVRNILGNIDKFNSNSTPNYAKIAKLQELLSTGLVTTYRYKPLVGLSSISFPDGRSEYYGYDDMGRLIYVADNSGNILNTYKYNYTH